ncbi:MAG: asparagine synthase C-terminal domain-containing protein, partial [Pseudomonadota bacterium]
LSGGIDSASLLALYGLSRDGSESEIHTYSWIPPPSTEEEANYSEWKWSNELAKRHGAEHHFVQANADDIFNLLRVHDLGLGDTSDTWSEHCVRCDAQSRNIRLLMSGWGGDQFISHYGTDVYAEAFFTGRIVRTLAEISSIARKSKQPIRRFLSILYRNILMRAASAGIRGNYSPTRAPLPDFSHFAHEDIKANVRPLKLHTAYQGLSLRSQQLCDFQRAHLCNRLRSWAATGRRFGLSYVFPLLDKRVVELALQIPPRFYMQQGIGRYVFRLAIDSLLPSEVCWANLKYEPRRVSLLNSSRVKALKRWLDECGDDYSSSSVIDLEMLKREIALLNERSAPKTRSGVLLMMSMQRSVLLANLEAKYGF